MATCRLTCSHNTVSILWCGRGVDRQGSMRPMMLACPAAIAFECGRSGRPLHEDMGLSKMKRETSYSGCRPALQGLLFACLAGSILAVPEKPRAESLADILTTTYMTSDRLDARRREYRGVVENIASACSDFRPTLNVQGRSRFNDYRADIKATGSESNDLHTDEVTLQLSQNIYRGGSHEAALRSARERVERQRAVLDYNEEQLMLSGATVYANLLRDRNVLSASRENVQHYERQLESTRKRRAIGEATRTDVSQAESRLAGAQSELTLATSNFETSVSNFIAVVGTPPGELEEVTDLPQPPASLDDALELVDNNPEIRAAQYQLRQADADIDDVFGRLLPTLDLVGELSYVNEPTVLIDSQRDAVVGVSLTVPLYQGGREHASVRQQKQIRLQRQHELADARRRIISSITSAYRQYEAAVQRARSVELQIAAAQAALDGVEKEVLGGTRLIIDTLDAQLELFRAQVSFETVKRDRLVSLFEVLAATGTLTPADLGIEVPPGDWRNSPAPGCSVLDFSNGID